MSTPRYNVLSEHDRSYMDIGGEAKQQCVCQGRSKHVQLDSGVEIELAIPFLLNRYTQDNSQQS